MNTQTQEALKMALNAMANKMESDNHGNPLTKYDEALQRAMDAGVEALATHEESLLVQPTIKESLNVEQPAQEPVAWRSEGGVLTEAKLQAQSWVSHGGKAIPLYTHPAPSWQGLSDDDVKAIEEVLGIDKVYIRAVERTLKEKNT